MASIGRTFITSEIPESDVLPEGKYVMQVYESDVEPTKRGDGLMLMLKCQVIDGEHKGRIVFDRINVQNPNEQAEAIAARHLAQLTRALKIDAFEDSTELHGKPFIAHVIVKKDVQKDADGNTIKTFAPKNEIHSFEAFTGKAPTAPVKPGSVTPRPNTTRTNSAPLPRNNGASHGGASSQVSADDPWS